MPQSEADVTVNRGDRSPARHRARIRPRLRPRGDPPGDPDHQDICRAFGGYGETVTEPSALGDPPARDAVAVPYHENIPVKEVLR